MARPFAAVVGPIIEQPIVIEGKTEAARAEVAANAKPDGYI